MEKFRISKSTKGYIGLLILLFVNISSLFAISYSQLRVIPEKEYCFAGETCLFTLKIPGVLPVNVDTLVQSTPVNVTVESLVKEEYIEDGTRGTKIKLIFRFSKAGTYQIPPLATRIYWVSYAIKFQPITVYDNPILLDPILTSDLPKNLEVGKPTTFTIYGKFFNELTNINFQLDKRMILEKSKDIQKLPYHIGTFSTETYPLAEFTVIPLEEGEYNFPQIFGLFRSYAGNSVSVALKDFNIKVTKASKEENQNEITETSSFLESFPEAFETQEFTENKTTEENFVDLEKLLEEKLKEKRILISLFVTTVIISLTSLFFIILFSILKRKSGIITFAIIFALFLTGNIAFGIFVDDKNAISLGSRVRTVPEENSNSVMQLTVGNIIKINNEISNWYSIELADKRKGWILKSECILINQHELKKINSEKN